MTTGGVGGRFDFDDGGSYAGDWTEGMAHGYGVCTGPGGEGEFAGEWQLGFETSGVYRAAATGAVYEGQWLQGRRHGLGVDSRGLPGSSGVAPRWMYRGEWTQGFRGRYGVRQSTATGTKYEGTWTAGLQDGYGVETYADGGTFQGQWLRGVRHGYGVRQSVSYDLAVRYPIHPVFPAVQLPVPGFTNPEKEDDVLLRERDLRIEETRGGFVLVARVTASDPDSVSGSHSRHRMVLDKHGKPSIRKTIVKMMRQRSAGDVRQGHSSSSRLQSGSVRSTSSHSSYTSTATSATGHASLYSDEGSETSFVSQPDLAHDAYGLEIVERYLGEWKGDRRAGYGVAERSDGLRYQGEWAANRKHGYGVTTLRDGTRIEGKYKNNILVASVSTVKTASKLLTLGSGKLRDRVQAAIKAADRAADVARQKAEIACARMLSARMKAEQVEAAARKATVDSEIARARAQEYSPTASQPGSNIIANRPTQETEMRPEIDYGLADGSLQSQSSPTRIFSLFKAKKTPSTVRSDLSLSVGIAPSNASTLPRVGNTSVSFGGSGGGRGFPSQNWDNGTSDSRNLGSGTTDSTFAAVSQHQPPNKSVFTSHPTVYANDASIPIETRIQQSYSTSTASSQMGFHPDRVSITGSQQQQQPLTYHTQSNGPDGSFMSSTPRVGSSVVSAGGFDGHSTVSPSGGFLNPSSAVRCDSSSLGGSDKNTSATVYREPSFYAHGDAGIEATFAAAAATAVGYLATAAPTPAVLGSGYDPRLVTPDFQRKEQESLDADYVTSPGGRPILGERRQSLPSIVKQRSELTAALASRPGGGHTLRQTAVTSAVGAVSANTPPHRPQVDTFFIQNGVRKRVKPIYSEQPSSVTSRSPLAVTSAAIKSKRRVFTLETARRPDMGSVPDISAVSPDEILPREVVAVLSQRRREELILQRAEDERRRRNQIVLCLADIKDWCDKHRVLVLLVVINICLASVFYNLLNNQ